MVFFPDLLIMVDYYVSHLDRIIGGVMCYVCAQVCNFFPCGWKWGTRASDRVIFVVFSGDVVVVGVCFDVVCVGDSGCVVNESVESVLEGGGVNGPIGMLHHQRVKRRGFAEQGREVGQIYVVSLSDTQDRGTYSNFTQVTPKDFFLESWEALNFLKDW